MEWHDVEILLGTESKQILQTCYGEPGDFLFGSIHLAHLPKQVAQQVAVLRGLVRSPATRVGSPADFFSVVRFLGVRRQECVVVALLDGGNRILGLRELFRGTATGATVSTRDVFLAALEYRASGVVVAHNHPSGQLLPSEEDDRFTGQLVRGGRLVGIPLVDHLIVGRGEFFSYRAAGRIIPSGRRPTSKIRPTPLPSDQCQNSGSN